MINTILDLLCIALITVIITDISGFFNYIQDSIARWLNIKKVSIYILNCSFCQNFWLSMIYLKLMDNLTIRMIALSLIISTLTPNILDLILKIKETLTKLIR